MSSYSEIQALRARPVVDVRLPASLLLPSFGVVVFAVALIEVLFLSQGAQGLFRDSETGWHIRNGEAIIQSLTLPRVDHFSYTRDGAEWFAWEWLSDAGLGLVYHAAGLTGVAFVAALAIALCAWGVARFALSLGSNLFVTAGAVMLLLGTTSIHWLARPHILSWLFALAFLAVAERERRAGCRALYVLPLLSCLWANLHGSFLLGTVILLIYAAGDWLTKGSFSARSFPRFSGIALLSLLASFINPYTWHLHQHIIAVLQNDYLMDHVSEFQSFSFHAQGAYSVEAFLLIAVLGIIALFRQRAYAPALLGLAMLHISLFSARHLPTAAVLLLPLAAAALTSEARRFARLHHLLDYSDRLLAMDRKVWGAVPLAFILVLTFAGTRMLGSADKVGFNPEIFPVQAANFLEREHVNGRVFAKDQWGGYLIYRFSGGMKVFVDGRGDFYGQQFLETYSQVADVKPAWNTVLKQYDVRFVLIPPDHALTSVLQLTPNWKRRYADSVATIFERVD